MKAITFANHVIGNKESKEITREDEETINEYLLSCGFKAIRDTVDLDNSLFWWDSEIIKPSELQFIMDRAYEDQEYEYCIVYMLMQMARIEEKEAI